MRTTLITLALVLAAGACRPAADDAPASADALPPDTLRLRVERAVDDLDALRRGLAPAAAHPPIDTTTFARACKPVGARAREIASANGWTVRQLADRYRNPDHRLDPEAAVVFARFESDANLDRVWKRSEEAGGTGWRYFQRITVEEACLACHGAEEARPAFVQARYPDDRAFGFRAGDLRGVYSVFVPQGP